MRTAQDTTIVFTDSLTAPATDTLSGAATAADSLQQADSLAAPAALYGRGSILEAPAGKWVYPEIRNTVPGLFEGFLGLGVTFLFFLAFHYLRNFLSPLISGLFNFHALEKQFTENSLSVVITGRALLFFAFVSISFFAWLLLLHQGFLEDPALAHWQYFLAILAVLAIFFLLKFILLRIIDYVGRSAPMMQLIIYFGRLCIIACGFLLFPVSLLIAASGTGAFLSGLMIAGEVIIILGFILYLVRIVRIFFTTRISSFFLILYLCTFEIAPFLLLYSFVSLS